MTEDLKQLAAEAEKVAQAKAEEVERRKPVQGRIVTGGQFSRAEIEKPPILVDRVLPGGSVALVAGQHKAGKTVFMLQLAMAVATGRDFLWWSTTKTPVLYLNYEVAPWSFQERWQRATMGFLGHGQSAIGEEADRIVAMRKALEDTLFINSLPAGKINRRNDLAHLRDEIINRGVGLVVVDPIRAAWGGNRNSDEEVDRGMDLLMEEIVAPARCAVLLGAHMRKPAPGDAGGGSSWEVKGSSGFADAVDAIVTIRKNLKDDSGLERFVNITSRHWESTDNLGIKLRPSSMTYVPAGEAADMDPLLAVKAAMTREGEMTMEQISEVMGCDRTWSKRLFDQGKLGAVRQKTAGSGKTPAIYVWDERPMPDPF